ncbi:MULTISPECIES: riboflavin kinase [Bacillaceae]|uniref:riboflavin kinase n=1 Tax=Bacillaceae TaxID=186817 RepID=UPI000E714CA3|nr:riboflavin kinase [Bacillus sp. PK3_68]RJS61905.1 hypothetical protein CJ483_19195 [Bacillus sp. PK3_68]
MNQLITGKIIQGEGKAKHLGFPTANVLCHCKLLNGVYGVIIRLRNERYAGIMNIGNKITFHDQFPTSIEIHIFDFNKQIYGEMIEAEIAFFIREEQKFPSVEDLITQVKEDIAYARSRFAKTGIRVSS